MALPTLIYDHVGTNPIIISERKFPTLTYDHVGTPPTTLSERPSTHIHQPMIGKAQQLQFPMQGTNNPCQKALNLHLTTNFIKAQHLYLIMLGTNPSCRKGSALTFDNQCQKGSALTFELEGTNPTVTSKWINTHI